MQTVSTLAALREQVAAWRATGLVIGFVPTMGNLHAGHYALLAEARAHCDRVVASVFVNPTQFGPNEDFSSYPRTPEADATGLVAAGCDLLFLPSVETMYPLGVPAAVSVVVPALSEVLCGAFRPGHFAGVASVVLRLFNMVQPDIAVFGRKDMQQLQVIRHLVTDLAVPLRIVGSPTLREASGLAMSSRNQYLTPSERALAPEIHQTLQGMIAALRRGDSPSAIEAAASERLIDAGFRVEYAVLRRESNLVDPLPGPAADAVALIAARLGRARLIDNLAWAEAV